MKNVVYETAWSTQRGNRPENQDRCILVESIDTVLLVLADGMGGHPRGEMAAQILVDTCEQIFLKVRKPIPDPASFLASLLHEAHDRIVAFGTGQMPAIEPRTTAVVALIQENNVYWAHAGDSRLYLLRNGRILTRTTDHSYVELLRQQGAISPHECNTHPDRNYVTRCLGGALFPEDCSLTGPTPLQPDDLLLLCSDGLWGQMDAHLLTEALQADQALPEIIGNLVRESVSAASPESDNVTALALRWIKGDPPMKLTNPEDGETALAQAVDNLRNAIRNFEKTGEKHNET